MFPVIQELGYGSYHYGHGNIRGDGCSGAGILDPFTWAVFFGPFFIYSSCSVMVSILYQDFRDGLFELYIQSGRSYWSYCWCKCLFPVILTVISVLLNLAFMRVLSSGFQITAGADDAIGALIVSVLGTIVCSLGAMPMVYVSRNSDPTMAQLVLVLIAILLQLAYTLVVVNVMPLCLFSVGYVVLVVVAIGISTGVFSRYFTTPISSCDIYWIRSFWKGGFP